MGATCPTRSPYMSSSHKHRCKSAKEMPRPSTQIVYLGEKPKSILNMASAALPYPPCRASVLKKKKKIKRITEYQHCPREFVLHKGLDLLM